MKKVKKVFGALFGIKIRLWAVIIVCALCVGATVLIGSASDGGGGTKGGDVNAGEASKFLEIKNIIDKYYVGDADDLTVSNAAYTAMLKSLGDQWSYYMTADEYQAYQLYAANQYEGIGVSVAIDGAGGFAIVAVASGSPAEGAGLRTGDVILSVAGESIAGLTANDVSTLIQSKMGESVTLSVKIKATGKTQDVVVNCATIYSSPVSYEMQERHIGYVKINNFQTGAATYAKEGVEALLAEGATAIVFDVRNNAGGLLTELTALLDYLLPAGDIFIALDENGDETVTRSDNVCIQMPMAVLINGGTYSAAEYFAAALEEYGWATTVGEPTTGKGRSQITLELSDGSAVHISNNSYLTPNRVDLSVQGGLVPTQAVEQKDKGDVQLDAAITLMIAQVKAGG